jgi:hypothetical protein
MWRCERQVEDDERVFFSSVQIDIRQTDRQTMVAAQMIYFEERKGSACINGGGTTYASIV